MICFAKTGLYGFLITNGEKSRSANTPTSAEFEESLNFRAMGRFCPTPKANRVNDRGISQPIHDNIWYKYIAKYSFHDIISVRAWMKNPEKV